MLATIGYVTVFLVLILILTNKASPLIALVVVPTLACLVCGRMPEYGKFVVSGIQRIAPTAAMFCYAIVFFNFLIEIGTFDPIVSGALRFAKNNPAKIMIAVVIISMVGHLDGAGSTTFILTVGAMLPIFKKLKLDPMYLIVLCGITAGIMNIVPWGGPTMRVMTVFTADASQVFTPMIIPMAAGLICTCGLAFYFGSAEKKRLAATGQSFDIQIAEEEHNEEKNEMGFLLYLNWALIVAAMFCLIKGILPAAPTMLVSLVAAFLINRKDKAAQDKVIAKYAPIAFNLTVVSFATAVFTGVLTGCELLDAMAKALVSIIPESLGGYFSVIVGILSFPFSFLFTPDAYYYSIVPTLSTAASSLGASPLIIGRASLMGQMTVGFPFSGLNATSYMLPEMVGISFSDFQKKGIPYAYGVSIVMTLVGLLCGVI